MNDDDNDELINLLLKVLYWCFWPRTWRQWVVYLVLFGVLTYLKNK